MSTTTTAKHTPGPWTHGRMFLGNAVDRRSGFIVNGPDVEPIPVRICDIRCSPESPFAVSEANARLIAAAPDMLESATEFLRVLDALREANVLSDWPVVRDTLPALRAAVAKATE